MFIFSLILNTGYSQRKVLIKNVTGTSVISNITPEEALEKAINSAKIKALREAGIPEIVHETNLLSTTEINEKFDQIFSSISSVEISGKVLDYEITDTTNYVNEFGNFVLKVTLNAEVIRYRSVSDKEFRFKIDGIKSVYQDNSKLSFTLHPYKEGYMHIFLFIGTKEALLVFPNKYEKNNCLKPDTDYNFPLNPSIEYELYCDKDSEINHLAFVFTKKDIPFNVEPGYKSVIKWIFSIEPSERNIIHKSLTIVK